MDQSGLSPKPLNLLESLMMEDDSPDQENNREYASRSPDYYDRDRQAVLTRESTASSYSEFNMGDVASRTKVVLNNPHAGFRGKKVKGRPTSAVGQNNKAQRPFSADYSKAKRIELGADLAVPDRAKSAKGSRQAQQMTFARGQRRRSVDSSCGTSTSDEECQAVEEPEYQELEDFENDDTDSSDTEAAINNVIQVHMEDGHSRYRRDNDLVSLEEEEEEEDDDHFSERQTPGSSQRYWQSSQPRREQRPNRRTQDQKQSPRLLSRKKGEKLRLFQANPNKYYDDKIQQKYTELKELQTGSVVDQRSRVIHGHLYQMDLLHNQYQHTSHGHLMTGPIIPQSLPKGSKVKRRPMSAKSAGDKKERPTSGKEVGEMRRRPVSAKKPTQRRRSRSPESGGRGFEVKTEQTETAVAIPAQTGAQPEAKPDTKQIEYNVEPADGPAENTVQSDTPRKASALDHHIKYSDNDYLKKWLKVKDKQYVRKIRDEKRKKKEEREKIILEANEKLEKRILAQKQYDSWMRSKNKEMNRKHKEEKSKQPMMRRENHTEAVFPGRSVHIKPLHSSVDSTKCSEENHSKTVDKSHQETQEEWRPPQTKFMYKRPISGRIKLYYQPKEKSAEACHPGQKLMQVRGKSPVAKPTDLDNYDHNERDVYRKPRSTSPEYRTRKTDGRSSAEKRQTLVDRQTKHEISWELRYLEKKRMAESERPSTAFGTDSRDSTGAEAGYEPGKRPATAPASRNVMPRPKTTVYSPRRAKLSPRSDEARASSSLSSSLPFPPEKGVPTYVADRQRKLFGDTMSFNEADQRELLHDVLVQEGVADVVDGCPEQSDKVDSESVLVEESANKTEHFSQRESKEFIDDAKSKREEKMFVKYAAFETVKTGKSDDIEEHIDSDLSLDSDSVTEDGSISDSDGKISSKQEMNGMEGSEPQDFDEEANGKFIDRNDSNGGSKHDSDSDGSIRDENSKSTNSIVSDIASIQDIEESNRQTGDLRERYDDYIESVQEHSNKISNGRCQAIPDDRTEKQEQNERFTNEFSNDKSETIGSNNENRNIWDCVVDTMSGIPFQDDVEASTTSTEPQKADKHTSYQQTDKTMIPEALDNLSIKDKVSLLQSKTDLTNIRNPQ